MNTSKSIYKCNRCNKVFNHKGDYKKHITRKNPCEAVVELPKIDGHRFECSKCHNIYSTKGNLVRHINDYCSSKCKSKCIDRGGSIENDNLIPIVPLSTEANEKNTSNSLQKSINNLNCPYCNKKFTRNDNLQRHLVDRCKKKFKINEQKSNEQKNKMQIEMEEMKNEIARLKQQTDNIVNMSNANINSNINSNNSINNNNYDIKVIAFGNEDLFDLISDDVAKKYLAKGYQSVGNLIKHVHFNEKYPQLQNVYISNTKDPHAHVFDGTRWQKRPKDEVVNQLFDDKQCFLIDIYKEVKHTLKESQRRKFERFLNEPDKDVIEGLKKEIKLDLYNDRHIPENNRKALKMLQQ